MNFRGDRLPHDVARSTYAGRRRHGRPSGAAAAVAVAAILAVSGCKTSGTGSSLAWWPGASKGTNDNEKLASAPSFDGKVEKPSETQAPYPTTTTPQSYALTPPPAASNAAIASAPSTPGGVAAQVGPYQGWPSGGSQTDGGAPSPSAASTAAPATSTPSGFAASDVPPSSSPPAAAGSSASLGFGSASSMSAAAVSAPAVPSAAVGPPDRYADARFGGGSAAGQSSGFSTPPAAASQSAVTSPAAVVPAAAAPGPTSRYSTSGSSQFGGGGQFQAEPAAPPAEPASFVPSASSAPTPSSQPLDAADPSDVADVAPQVGTNRLRASATSAGPSTPPARRPDPQYRPGGTSTYRPSQAIVDVPLEAAPVRQASFDSPLR